MKNSLLLYQSEITPSDVKPSKSKEEAEIDRLLTSQRKPEQEMASVSNAACPNTVPPKIRPARVVEIDAAESWMILIAGMCVYALAFGMVTSYGVYFVTFLKEFRVQRSQAAAISSIMYLCVTGSGPLSSVLYQKFGSRKTVMLGGVIAASGYLMSYFANSMGVLAITHAVSGIGFGICIIPVWSTTAEHFERYRSLAMGLVPVGGGLGLFMFPPFFEFFIEQFTWRGSMLINAGIALQVCVFGAVMRPVSRQRADEDVQSPRACHQLFQLQLLLEPRTWLFVLAFLSWGCAGQVFYQFSNALAQYHCVSANVAPLVTSICGLFDAIGKMTASLFNHYADRRRSSSPVVTFSLAMFAYSSASLAATVLHTLPSLLLNGAVFGLCFGLMLGSLGASAVRLFGTERLPPALGLANLFCSLGGFTGPIVAGSIGDRYGLEKSFYFSAFVGVCGACCALALVFIDRSCRKQTSACVDAVAGAACSPSTGSVTPSTLVSLDTEPGGVEQLLDGPTRMRSHTGGSINAL